RGRRDPRRGGRDPRPADRPAQRQGRVDGLLPDDPRRLRRLARGAGGCAARGVARLRPARAPRAPHRGAEPRGTPGRAGDGRRRARHRARLRQDAAGDDPGDAARRRRRVPPHPRQARGQDPRGRARAALRPDRDGSARPRPAARRADRLHVGDRRARESDPRPARPRGHSDRGRARARPRAGEHRVARRRPRRALPAMTHAKRSHPNVTLAVLCLGGLAYSVLSSAVVPALPTMQRELHTSETGITWLLTGYLLAASVGTSILGRLGDMYGKERLLLWTLSSSLPLLIVARVVQGVSGGIFPLAFGIVRDEFPREKVAGSIGLMS